MLNNGFIPIPQNQPLLDFPLPVADEATYQDGYAGGSPGQASVITTLNIETVLTGDMIASIEQVGSDLVFLIRLAQTGVFGFGLVDSSEVQSQEFDREADQFSPSVEFRGLHARYYRRSTFRRLDS